MVDSTILSSFFRWSGVQFPPSLVPSASWQAELYQATVGSQLARQFPVEREYCIRFCKNVIQFCQDCNMEVSEQFYEKMGELHLQPPSDADSADFYKTYFLSSDPSLTVSLREAKAVISGGTTGLSSWTAGEYLACWLDGQDRARLVEGRRVVELGAGSGISGIFAVKRWRGIREYSFTDCHGKVLHNLGHNVERNCAGWSVVREDPLEMVSEEGGTVVRVMELNWEEFDEETKLDADIILGADIVFDPRLLPSLVKTLAILIRRGEGCEAYLVCCVRNEETWQMFLALLGQAGLSVNTSLLEGESTTPVCMVHVANL